VIDGLGIHAGIIAISSTFFARVGQQFTTAPDLKFGANLKREGAIRETACPLVIGGQTLPIARSITGRSLSKVLNLGL